MSAHRWILPATAGLLIGCGTDAGSPFAPERFPARPSASATPACADIEAGGQTFAINAFTFKSFGSVEATVDGEATPVAVTTYLLGAPRATSDGTLLARTSP